MLVLVHKEYELEQAHIFQDTSKKLLNTPASNNMSIQIMVFN